MRNDAAVAGYVREAVVYAEAGYDIVAPSGMMDGQVGAIRAGLDTATHHDAAIVAYAAKYASAFYGPFRDAAESGMQSGDRADHQMDPADRRAALREVWADVEQGADVVMVKPALAYLDVIWRVREQSDVPVAAYHVSGEYAMLKAAARNGWLDERRAVLETLTSLKRAGADILITYYATQAAEWLAGRGDGN